MHKFLLLLACLCISFAALQAQTLTYKIGAADQSKLEKAIDDYQHARYRQSAEALRKLSEKYPADPDIYFYLGLNAVKRDFNVTGIRKYFAKVIQLSPSYPDAVAHYYMGLIHYTDNQFEAAEADFNRYFDRANTHGTPASDALYEEASAYLYWSTFLAEAYRNQVPFNPYLVRGVSSAEDEMLPFFTLDGRHCYFLRHTAIRSRTSFYNHELETKQLRLFCSTRTDTLFGPAHLLPAPFNQGDPEGGVTLTANNRELYYSVIHREHGYNNSDLFLVRFDGHKWGPITPLGDAVNRQDTWESQPSITPDGQWLYFASNRPGGMGGTDIWRCQRQADGSWGQPQNLGATVNTSGNEKCPFIHADGHTLYFSSNGWQGFGGYDMYFIDLHNTEAKIPINMGLPINTENDDISFGVTPDGLKGYFAGRAANANLGGNDILMFDLYPAARPEPMTFYQGTLQYANGTPAAATVILSHGGVTHRYQADEQGAIALLLSASQSNSLVIQSPGHPDTRLTLAPGALPPAIIQLSK